MAKYPRILSMPQVTTRPTATTHFVSLWIQSPDDDNNAFTIWGRAPDKSLSVIGEFPESCELAATFCAAHLAYTMGIPVENWPEGANLGPLNAQLYMANNNTGSIQ